MFFRWLLVNPKKTRFLILSMLIAFLTFYAVPVMDAYGQNNYIIGSVAGALSGGGESSGNAGEVKLNKGILDDVANKYKGLQDQWFGAVVGFAWKLFWGLATLDLIWSGISWVMERKEFGEMVVALCRKTLTIGFFALLLQMANSWIPAIIESFVMIGQAACGGECSGLSPSGLFGKGIDVSFGLLRSILELNFFSSIALFVPAMFCMLVIIICFMVAAGQMLVTLVESYLAIGAGIIMLGFGGSRWTSDMASSYLKFAVGTGVKLMMTYIVSGAGLALFSNPNITGGESAYGLLGMAMSLMAQAIIFVFLVWNIPGLAAGMLSGSPNASLGGLIGAATSIGAAAAGIATGGAGLMGAGAAQTAGMGRALGAGFSAQRAAGGSLFGSMAGASGEVMRSGLGIAAQKAGSGVSNAVSQTFGGRIADDINQRSATNSAPKGGGEQNNQPTSPTSTGGGSSGNNENSSVKTGGATGQTMGGGNEPSPSKVAPSNQNQTAVPSSQTQTTAPQSTTFGGSTFGSSTPTSQASLSTPQTVSASSNTNNQSSDFNSGSDYGSDSMFTSGISDTDTTSPSNFGDATGASFGTTQAPDVTQQAINQQTAQNQGAQPAQQNQQSVRKQSLQDAIKNIQSYIPPDSASVSTGGFSLSHGRD